MARRLVRGGWAMILAGWLAGAGSSSAADGPPPPLDLPSAVEQALWWLPEDTETLIVARPFVLTRDPEVGPPRTPTWRNFGAELGLNGEGQASKEKPAIPALNDQLQQRVESLVMGGRRYESVSSFGALRSEACTIVRFADDQPIEEDRAASYRRQASKVRTIAGREVFAFPGQFTKEPWMRSTDWEGVFVVLLDVRTLLIATSDRYLTEVLGRVAVRTGARALPDALPEWRQVDPLAPCWLLRHYPGAERRSRSVGVAATWRDDGFRVAYLAEPGQEVKQSLIQEAWFPQLFAAETRNRQLAHARFERLPGGSLALHYDAAMDLENLELWFCFQIYRTMAADLFMPTEG